MREKQWNMDSFTKFLFQQLFWKLNFEFKLFQISSFHYINFYPFWLDICKTLTNSCSKRLNYWYVSISSIRNVLLRATYSFVLVIFHDSRAYLVIYSNDTEIVHKCIAQICICEIEAKFIFAIISLIVISNFGKYYICTFVNESCLNHFKTFKKVFTSSHIYWYCYWKEKYYLVIYISNYVTFQ